MKTQINEFKHRAVYRVSEVIAMTRYNSLKGFAVAMLTFGIVFCIALFLNNSISKGIENYDVNKNFDPIETEIFDSDILKNREKRPEKPFQEDDNSSDATNDNAKKVLGLDDMVAANPNATNDSVNKNIDFATSDVLHKAYSKPGDYKRDEIIKFTQPRRIAPIQNIKIEPEIDYDQFSVDEAPNIDMQKLRQSIEYPRMAIDARIEGKVMITALIDINGNAIDYSIDYSDSDLLNKAVIKAVKNAKFTPAVHRGKNVNCRVSIPITFKLDN